MATAAPMVFAEERAPAAVLDECARCGIGVCANAETERLALALPWSGEVTPYRRALIERGMVALTALFAVEAQVVSWLLGEDVEAVDVSSTGPRLP